MIQNYDNMWDNTVSKLSSETCGKGVWEIIQKLSFAAVVYHIWQERNSRIFNASKRSEEAVVNSICDDVRAKLMSVNVKTTVNVLRAEKEWNIIFTRRG